MSNTQSGLADIHNNGRLSLQDIPVVSMTRFRDLILDRTGSGERVSALFGAPDARALHLYAVLANDEGGSLGVVRTRITDSTYPALTPECPQVHLFEREIAEEYDVHPDGHPWLKAVRELPDERTFFRVGGDEVHEVAVGPVHAGVIEPGHFRFQCAGETVLHLEIALGYQHRGVERALRGGPDGRSLHYAETVAGDTTVAHATTFSQVVESLSDTEVSDAAQDVRAIGLELERLANHVGDLGAIAGDVGFLPTAAYCGRIRGDFLNMSALLCGNRFSRGLVVPGGVGFDLSAPRIEELLKRLDRAQADARSAIELMFNTPSVLARLEDTGYLDTQTARNLGIVGPAARACGIAIDVRAQHPTGAYRSHQVFPATQDTGDVFSRAMVRWVEIQSSIELVRSLCRSGAKSTSSTGIVSLTPNSLAVGLNEGWRGEVCHIALTDENGTFSRYKMIDPSFHNWPGLAFVMRNQEISDFPLCNKSFNLSYCGHDL